MILPFEGGWGLSYFHEPSFFYCISETSFSGNLWSVRWKMIWIIEWNVEHIVCNALPPVYIGVSSKICAVPGQGILPLPRVVSHLLCTDLHHSLHYTDAHQPLLAVHHRHLPTFRLRAPIGPNHRLEYPPCLV